MFQRALVLFLFNFTLCFATSNDLEVIVYSAPVFKLANGSSFVIERLKKGDQLLARDMNKTYSDEKDLFIQIITKKGSVGFIKVRHVKNTTQQISQEKEFDETNYNKRMMNKHAKNIPKFSSKMIFLGGFPKPISSPTDGEISIENQSFSYGLGYSFTKKIESIKKSNLYIGGAFRYFYDKSLFTNSNQNQLSESLAAYTIGPTFSFYTNDFFNFKNEVTVGPTISLINQTTSFGDLNLNYQTITPGLHVSNNLSIKNIIPMIDFIFGLSFDFNALNLQRINNVSIPNLINKSSIENPYQLQASLLFGLQINQ